MLPIGDRTPITNLLTKELNISSKKESSSKSKADSLEISNTMNAFKKLDNFMNLGSPDRLDTSDLTPDEKKEFLKMLSKLLQNGIVGYEELEVDGKKEKHYIVNQIGNQRLKDAELWEEDRYTPRTRNIATK